VRIALIGRTISYAATVVSTATLRLAFLAIRWRRWRISEFLARTNRSEVDRFDLLGLQESGPGEHE
jgi:hypothetical protein